jgi:Exopolysaccharide biosynthesis protein
MNPLKAKDVLVGYYGYRNFGDDLFRDVLLKALKSKSWSAPVVSQHEPGSLAKLRKHAREAVNLLRARSVTLGGGSILGERPPASIRNIELAATRIKNLTYCAIGVGVLEGLADLPHALLCRMSWVGLRSERDFMAVREHYRQATYTSDLAYATMTYFPEIAHDLTSSGEVTVIPSVVGELGRRSAEPGYISAWLKGNVLRSTCGHKQLKIIVLQPGFRTESELAERWTTAAERLGIPVRIVLHQAPMVTLKEISSSRFVYTDRLHGAIAAHLSRVPFRLSRHHPKCLDLLSDLGHPDAGEVPALADDMQGSRTFLVEEWSLKQQPTVRRHIDLAESGIHSWLAHLEEHLE